MVDIMRTLNLLVVSLGLVAPAIAVTQQPPRTVAGRLVLVAIPIGIVQRRRLDDSTRFGPFGPLGRRVACHGLSVPALLVRLIAAKAALVAW